LIPEPLIEPVRTLLRVAGMSVDFTAAALNGGRNNQVYRLESGGRSTALKVYFHHPADKRDRIGAEYAFARFAAQACPGASAVPLGVDFEHRIALYEFISGRRLTPGEVDAGAVGQALAFFAGLNRHRESAGGLSAGSEACFTIADHLAAVEGRVSRHRDIEVVDAEDAAARAFIVTSLIPAWQALRDQVADSAGDELDVPLASELRCVSPSDFGFHNAILAEGRLRFIDFEYAGWDDPAKVAGDFLNQVELPVPLMHLSSFIAGVASALGDDSGRIDGRARLLLPVYAVRWCCIILNDFQPIDRERRRFALGRDRKAEQLTKARAAFDRLQSLTEMREERHLGLR
jgi:hypothetical protein